MQSLSHNIPASSLNNSAIMYLQAGKSHEAMELLQIALSKLRDQFMESEESDWDSQCDDDEPIQESIERNDDQWMKCNQESTEVPSKAFNVFSSIPVWMPQDTSFLIFYDRALLVDTNSPCHDSELLSAVILFNMALLHHSRGVSYCKTDSLELASRLYRIALDILQKEVDLGSNYLLLMAIFNNLAHIDSHLFRMEEMKKSLEEIRTILMSDVIDADDISLDEDDYAIFFMNSMFGNEKELAVAPAA
jgi:tetratricopeptide (TPR) repeat protein